MMKLPLLCAAVSALALGTSAARADDAAPAAKSQAPAAAGARPTYGDYGFDAAGMDLSVKPGDDFYSYANGTWAKTTPIPADKSNYGAFNVLDDLSRERTRGILEEAMGDPASKIGAAYASFMNEKAVEAQGLAPIRPWLDEIRAVKTRADYGVLAAKAARSGVAGPFRHYVGQDDKDPSRYILSLGQGGLGLPDRDFYLQPDEKMAAITLRTS